MIKTLACFTLAISCALGCASQTEEPTEEADRESEALPSLPLYEFRDKHLVNGTFMLCPSPLPGPPGGPDTGIPTSPTPSLVDTTTSSCDTDSRVSLSIGGGLSARGRCFYPNNSFVYDQMPCEATRARWTYDRVLRHVISADGTCLTAVGARVALTGCDRGRADQKWSFVDSSLP
jgi:hypothetical protein